MENFLNRFEILKKTVIVAKEEAEDRWISSIFDTTFGKLLRERENELNDMLLVENFNLV